MKLPAISFLNSLGFTNLNQKIAYAAFVLKGCVGGNPKKIVLFPRTNISPEIAVPAIRSSGQFVNAVSFFNFDSQASKLIADVWIPYLEVHKAVNASFTPDFLGEITPNSIPLNAWLSGNVSITPETLTQADEPSTLEQYLYKYASISNDCTISSVSMDVPDGKGNTVTLPAKQVHLELPLDEEYDYGNPQIQLDKILPPTLL